VPESSALPERKQSAVAPEARQRWRLVLARTADAPSMTQHEVADAWLVALESSELPLHHAMTGARPKLAFGAPLPVGMAGEAELLDLVLTERWPVWRVRATLEACLPAGWRLVDLHDVWLAGPALAGRVAAADYRIAVAGVSDAARLRAAAEALLARPEVPRERAKGTGTVLYDLRPLLLDVRVVGGGGTDEVALRVRTRIHPELGSGRPDEVVAALAEALGEPLLVRSIARERLVLIDELDRDASTSSRTPT
jgi:radical SAM-linked protein